MRLSIRSPSRGETPFTIAQHAHDRRVEELALVLLHRLHHLLAERTGRRAAVEPVPVRHVVQLVVVERGLDLARVDGRDRHAGAVQLVAERLGEAALRGLGAVVDGRGREAAHAAAGRDHHDVAAAALEHARERRPDGVDRAEPVHVVHVACLVERQLRERPVVGDAGVGDEHVDVAELLDRAAIESGSDTSAASAHVARARQLLRELLERLAAARHESERGAARRERAGDRLRRFRARRPSRARESLARSPWRAMLRRPLPGARPARLGSSHVPGASHRRRGGVPPDHLLAPGGRPTDHRSQHRPRDAGLGADRPRDDRPPRGRRLRDPRRRQVARVHRLGPGARRGHRPPPPADRALPHGRVRHPLGPGARGGRAARALDVADGRGAHAARDRRRQDLPARPPDLRGRARDGRAARRRRGGREACASCASRTRPRTSSTT